MRTIPDSRIHHCCDIRNLHHRTCIIRAYINEIARYEQRIWLTLRTNQAVDQAAARNHLHIRHRILLQEAEPLAAHILHRNRFSEEGRLIVKSLSITHVQYCTYRNL